jgi:integrase
MNAHIEKRGDAWRIVLELGHDANGKRIRRIRTYKGTKRDAQSYANRLLQELETGTYVERSKLTLSEHLERWLTDYAEPNVSGKTFERYGQIVHNDLLPALGHLPLTALTPVHIQDYYSWALKEGRKNGSGGLSAQTVLHHHRLLKQALGHAVKWQLLARNPADAVEPPRVQRQEMQALDAPDLILFMEAAKGTRLNMPILLAATTGMRRGELLALRWSDVDLGAGILSVTRSLQQTREGVVSKPPKTRGAARTLALPALTIEALREHRLAQTEQRLALGPAWQENDIILCLADGRAWKPSSFSAEFHKFARGSGFGIRFHDLRHSHASQLLREGVPIKVVSERLGHSNSSITLDVYSHVLPGMQQEAARLIDSALRGKTQQQ